MAIGYFPEVHPELRSTKLYSQQMSCIAARGSLSELLLESQGHERLRSIRVASVLLIPHIVAGSNHLATLPTWMCKQFATTLPLDIWPLPFESPELETIMVWHERTHRQSLFIWLRNLIRNMPAALDD